MSDELLAMLRATKYPQAAFAFVQQGLDFTVRRARGDATPEPGAPEEPAGDPEAEEPHHVTGEELCWGLRDYAVAQYGLMAPMVLRRWHIHGCEDFGEIVFAMVRAGLMQKTEEDSPKDFEAVFDFAKAFPRHIELD